MKIPLQGVKKWTIESHPGLSNLDEGIKGWLCRKVHTCTYNIHGQFGTKISILPGKKREDLYIGLNVQPAEHYKGIIGNRKRQNERHKGIGWPTYSSKHAHIQTLLKCVFEELICISNLSIYMCVKSFYILLKCLHTGHIFDIETGTQDMFYWLDY